MYKALAFTLSPDILLSLVDVLLVDPFFSSRAWPWMRRTVAEAVVEGGEERAGVSRRNLLRRATGRARGAGRRRGRRRGGRG